MMKDDIQKLRSCIDLLDQYEKPLRESLEGGGQMEEPPAVMLLRGFAFGRATLKAMVAVADGGDEACGVCLPTLCRPFYELAVKVLWASREPDGWERIQAQREGGKTFVISTNNMVEAESLCDRLLIIDHGKAIALDTPENLKAGMQYDVVSIRTSPPIEAPEALLAGYEVRNIARPGPDELRFEMQHAEARAASLINEISTAHRLNAILIARPSLDDVFLFHTGRALRE